MKRICKFLVALPLISVLAAPLAAKPVQNVFGETTLTGNLQLSDGKSLSDGVVLITHGTLGHGKMDIIKSLQSNLDDAGYSSLAINLSLGAPDREFMYDCKTTHRHKHHDAMAEIAAWVKWLEAGGASAITVVGHSRGGNQTAWYAAEQASDSVDKVVLIAPSTWDAAATRQSYEARYKVPLEDVLNKARKLSDQGQPDSLLTATGFLYCSLAKVSAGSFQSYYSPDPRRNTPHLLTQITRPTLVIAGSDDTVVKNLEEQVQGTDLPDNIKLEVVDGAGHFFRDLYGEDLSDLIVEFLAGE